MNCIGEPFKIKLDGTKKTPFALHSGFKNGETSILRVIGDWIYYTDSDQDYGGIQTICKIKTDETDKKEIVRGVFHDIAVDNGSVYYVLVDLSNNVFTSTNVIYKINTDGTGKITLIDDKNGLYSNLIVSGDWIYYLSNYTVYKMKTDGTKMIKVGPSKDRIVREFNVAGNWIYYAGAGSEGPGFLYKMKIDGTANVVLDNNASQSENMNIVGNWIYYNEDNTLKNTNIFYKIKTDGTEKTKVN